ncbi:hypothetical protein KS4_30110 [Poriferisphaera corsica]|uniref:Uncharacterized protein n=1 Tax=Poriferisphaera corsica TaxID=2528020 RepID=A0A517YXI2_9BACT|nr:hypothetical protein KS4_30110 [Poriferisphaera corsica]
MITGCTWKCMKRDTLKSVTFSARQNVCVTCENAAWKVREHRYHRGWITEIVKERCEGVSKSCELPFVFKVS